MAYLSSLIVSVEETRGAIEGSVKGLLSLAGVYLETRRGKKEESKECPPPAPPSPRHAHRLRSDTSSVSYTTNEVVSVVQHPCLRVKPSETRPWTKLVVYTHIHTAMYKGKLQISVGGS